MIWSDHMQKNDPEWQFANCKWWSLKIWWSSWPILSWRSPSWSRSGFILHLKLRVQNIFLIIQFLVIYLGRRIMGSSCNVCLIDGEDLKKKLLRGRTLKSVIDQSPNSLDFSLNYFNKIWPYQIAFALDYHKFNLCANPDKIWPDHPFSTTDRCRQGSRLGWRIQRCPHRPHLEKTV